MTALIQRRHRPPARVCARVFVVCARVCACACVLHVYVRALRRYSIIQLALFASLLKFLMQKANFDGDYNWEAVTKFIVCVAAAAGLRFDFRRELSLRALHWLLSLPSLL